MKDGYTPAAINALLAGNLGNFAAAMRPGGIEAQEAAGQAELALGCDRLPIAGTSSVSDRQRWESLGFVFGDQIQRTDGGPVFVQAKFPDGWLIRPSSASSYWSDILDGRGRVRAVLFHKAAFYDFKAHVDLCCRYTVRSEYDDKYQFLAANVVDVGGDKVIRRCEAVGGGLDARNEAIDIAREWLDREYPDNKDPMAYWDS